MGSLSGRQWLILLSVQFTTILFGLTATSVTVILPQLKGALSATQEQISWVLTFNLVATAIATPLTGWLAAKLGWRTLMACSVTGFTLTSVLCGLVDSLEGLLALRVVQGAFGAPIFPMGQTILLSSFHRSQHPFIIMMWGVGGVMGPIIGPTFGGLVTDLLSWRWTFFLILPLGLVALTCVLAALGDQEKGTARRFDHVGFIFIAIAIAAAQLLFDRGQRNDWFELGGDQRRSGLGGAVLHHVRDPLGNIARAPVRPSDVPRPQLRRRHRPRADHGHAAIRTHGAVPAASAGTAGLSRGLDRLPDRLSWPGQPRLLLDRGPAHPAEPAPLPRPGAEHPGGGRPVDGVLRHQPHFERRDVEQHAARVRLRPQLHADGGARLLDLARHAT